MLLRQISSVLQVLEEVKVHSQLEDPVTWLGGACRHLHQTYCGLQRHVVDREHQGLVDDDRLHGTSGRKYRYHRTSLSRDRGQQSVVKYYANKQITFFGSVVFTAAIGLVAVPIPGITSTLPFSSTLSGSLHPFALLPYLVFVIIIWFKWIVLFQGIPDCNGLSILVLTPSKRTSGRYTRRRNYAPFSPFFHRQVSVASCGI